MKYIKTRISYIILAAALGAVIGAIEAGFSWALYASKSIREISQYWFLPFLALGGVVIVFFFKKFGSGCEKGMGMIYDAYHDKTGEAKVPLKSIPLMIGSTFITHLFGGSSGREGVAVQIGAAVAHTTGRILPEKNAAKILMVAGMAAGFAGLFKTPFAAVAFALEVIVIGELRYEALIPAAVAAVAANFVSGLLGVEIENYVFNVSITIDGITLLKLIAVGAMCGLIGAGFAALLKQSHKVFAEKIANPYIRIIIIGVIVSVIMILSGGRYSGTGTNLIEDVFVNGSVQWQDWFMKLILTAVCLGAGFKGGEVAPMFSIGATFGFFIGPILGLDPYLTAALCFAAVFGSGTGTLLAPMLIGGEIFGWQYAPLFILVVLASKIVNQRITVYSGQKISYLEEQTND